MKAKSPAAQILLALIPYTKQNLSLSFSPNKFFNELERNSNLKTTKNSFRTNYYRLVSGGYIDTTHQTPKLTGKGIHEIKKFKGEHLKNSHILVIFDIPEEHRSKRNTLRLLLRELNFKQIQKSVWATEYDYRDYLKEEIKINELDNFVVVFEAKKIF